MLPFRLWADSNIDGQTVTFTQFINEMAACTKYTTFENVKIRYKMPDDKEGMDKRFGGGEPELFISSSIRLVNCDFDVDYWLVLRNVTFNDYFAVANSSPLKIIFKHCTFKKTLRFYNNNIDFIDMDSCRLEHGFKFFRNDVKDRLTVKNSGISVNPALFGDTDALDMEPRLFRFANKQNAFDLEISNCSFELRDNLRNNPQFYLILTESDFKNLSLTGNNFNCSVDLSESTVQNAFVTNECRFNGSLIMDAFNINPINTRVQWSTVASNRISIFDHKKNAAFNGNNIDSVTGEVNFASLISCYANFYNAFKSQGNRIAANACYVEWKDIETRYLKNEYSSGRDKSVFFNYLMNVFLKVFCDYGTNPLKAIQIAFYVLLFFAGIYFFFPYSILSFHKRTMFDQLKIYGHYLSSPKSLLEIEDSVIAKEDKTPTYSDYMKFVTDSKGKVPWYFHIFGKPLYFLELIRNKPTKLFYRIIDIFPDEWETMSKTKRVAAAIMYGVVFMVTVLWFLLIHILDSVALSLNVFSTLGFGQIPIKGIPRYLTILEGFIGWFLLSIFSVSLISQVIQ
ncbi:MAG: hypothetical protein UZ05_CHB002002642 [Chlorobi bacterium OLB5]|nr:MAG: hypothetical protein UZ05_CHB002002642 [Chlorobi bacterium OLB5]